VLKRLIKHANPSDFTLQGIAAYAVQIAAVGLTYLLNVILARWLGVEQYGVYTLAYNTVLLLAVLGGFGFRFSSLKIAATAIETEDWAAYKGFVFLGTVLTSAGTVILTIVVTVVVTRFYTFENDYANLYRLLIGLWITPIYALFEFYADLMRSAGYVTLSLGPSRALRPLLLLGITWGLMIIFPATALPALLALLVSTTLILLFFVWQLARDTSPHTRDIAATYTPREWLPLSLRLLLVQGVAMAQDRVPVLAVGLLLSEASAGIYSVAFRLATLLTLSFDAAGLVLAPRIAPLVERGAIHELELQMRTMIRWSLLIAVLLGAGVLLAATPLLRLFGAEFVVGRTALAIAVFGQILRTVLGPAAYVLNLSGHERLSVRLSIIIVGITLLLTPLLTTFGGIEGAAFAVLISQVLQGALFYRAVQNHVGAHPLRGLLPTQR
jgi:O-antigen/teichoic acid export membrane protein